MTGSRTITRAGVEHPGYVGYGVHQDVVNRTVSFEGVVQTAGLSVAP